MAVIKANQRLNRLVEDNFKIIELELERLNDDWFEVIYNNTTYTIYVDPLDVENVEKDIQQFLEDEFLYDLVDREDIDIIKLKEFNIDNETGVGSLTVEIIYF